MANPPSYIIGQAEPFKLSRSKLEDFVQCPRCFVLDRRHKVAPPSGPSFTLNSAVDSLLKKEFDVCRISQTTHPSIAKLGYDFVPYADDRLSEWQKNTKGVVYVDHETNISLYGAVDDIWRSTGENSLHIVDYKTTSKSEPVTVLGNEIYHDAYRRQLDIYNFLLSQNGLTMSSTGYWFYATARKNADAFNMSLVFDPTLLPYECDVSWIAPTLVRVKEALETPELPESSEQCQQCSYVSKRFAVEDPTS
jgi:hypothetical protein